jgi:hypothetical protein
MTVEQLITALLEMPKDAVVLYEGDGGYALVGGVHLQQNPSVLPDEVILFSDMNE